MEGKPHGAGSLTSLLLCIELCLARRGVFIYDQYIFREWMGQIDGNEWRGEKGERTGVLGS